ncbi:phosphoribosylamine--glycine ligase [Flavobacteriaceae bacterium]|jgi:phosphoribosylamine--glycine ligase|nr:phosphoribosylamine--glycine ligase [Flavobacteriaceae bacterium]MDA8904196.1 phosphoribosylamine--glycine ligase [bacterium]MDA9631636.1 phosphoribosylamine--glycine ligase [Bacteroidota bacterium]MDA8904386.1 phosphoribosylamine--glycine ligase [Flavobacteriaceae bacterium]MDA9067201.1 phosphoribosylamine--glycine ligase [Flavobacteriaceae bacterium]
MNILILGSGGREHAFALKIADSKLTNKLYVAPGNSGTQQIATNIPININDFEQVKKTSLELGITMIIVGPEDPLVNGIHDFFARDEQTKSIAIIGPKKKAASLEGSKDFAKKFLIRHNIPTASYATFTKDNLNDGFEFLKTLNPPYVLKADGLAAGKGVLIIDNLEEANNELREMLVGEKFGIASSKVVIEEFLDGIELSCFVLTDGVNYKVLPTAKDYKRIGEGDSGLNTGGMGAISPVPFAKKELLNKIEQNIITPTIEGLKKDGIEYQGFIFIGLINVNDEPKVIEYNVRMGDPETEAVLPRIQNDFVEIFQSFKDKTLNKIDLKIDNRSAATVVLVSGGYPSNYNKGIKITGIDHVVDSTVYHAGAIQKEGGVYTNGGRVLAITSFGNNFQEALDISYKSASKINFDRMYYRKDLGFDL